jgi:hypothetical protein
MRAASLGLALLVVAGCDTALGGTRRDASAADEDAGADMDAARLPDAYSIPFDDTGAVRDAYSIPFDDTGPPGVGPNECPAEPQPDPVTETVIEPGPIVRYTVRPYYTLMPDGVTTRPPMLTGDILAGGVWLVPLGDTLVADSNQKNAANRLCQWIELPTWTLDDPYCSIHRLPSRNPFLLRARTEHVGDLTIQAHIDGIDSNVVPIRVIP